MFVKEWIVMYDLTDLIFEKYNEGKLSEEKMILLLEASSKITVYDKASWHIDNGENKNEVLKKMKIIFDFLNKNSLLNSDGKELFDLGINEDSSLHDGLVTNEGKEFLDKNIDKIISKSSKEIEKTLENLYKNKTVKAIPNVSVGGIKFGMNRDAVRKIINNEYSEFKKHQKVKNTADDFGLCHVYYDENNKCEAIEFFDDVEILLGNKTIFPSTLSNVKQMINDIEKDGSLMYISKAKSIGITVNEKGKIKSILFGCKKYYTNQVLEASSISLEWHDLPFKYKGVKLCYYKDEINEKTDIPYIKNALKILNSSKCQSMIEATISQLDEYADEWGCPDYRKYMKLDYVTVDRYGDKITFNINWNSIRSNGTTKFFGGHFYSVDVTIDGNNITKVYGCLNG
jgi:hypothetical protein